MKYIITSVQLGALVNRAFLTNLLLFAKENGVEKLYAFVQNGRYKDEEKLHPLVLEHFELIYKEQKLNDNLKLFDTKILAQQINPMTGMAQKLSRDYTHILPSPKIRFESLASTNTHQRSIMTTGALTHGNYKLHTAQGMKAEQQHQYGFVFVEVFSNKYFSTVQIEAKKNGSFHYKREKYFNGKKTTRQPEVLVMGDWHTGDTCPKSRKETIAQLEELQPKRAVFHDLFNGHSINPHEKNDLLSDLRNYKGKRISLIDELKLVYKEMLFFAKKFPKITFIVSESNHDIFFERYIRSRDFMYDAENFLFICDIINEVITGKKPTLEIALSAIGEIPKNFVFLKEDQEYRVRGWEVGYHGHRGANGSRGTSKQFSYLNLKTITGHTHTPAVLANSVTVGTNTRLRLGYTKGATSWVNANAVLYENGTVSLLVIIPKPTY